MKPVKNKSKSMIIRMHPAFYKFLDCWLCGKPQIPEDETTFMHYACWEKATERQREQAERDCRYGGERRLNTIIQGCGGQG
jgi:hypothetical protein